LSIDFSIRAIREGQVKELRFSKGIQVDDLPLADTSEPNGTMVVFRPDESVFRNFRYINDYVINMIKNYTFLNAGLTIEYNGQKYYSKNGLRDLLEENLEGEPLYPIIHLKGEDIEIAMTHGNQYGEDYYSFVNGQHTSQGGTHLQAFREVVVKTIRDFYKKDFDPSDIRASIVAAISIKVEEPVFESQTKTKLGSRDMGPDGPTVRTYVTNFVAKELDNYLHKNADTAEVLLRRIQESERERKAISGIKKLAKARAKKVSLHNRKLRDCRIHYNDNDEKKEDTSIFITEGDSASGSITKSRDVDTQAVFSLKGKPLNTYGLTKKVVYENEEFNLLQAALNIEDDIEDLRYNKVIIATDADVDGMHIRLLLITFFIQFFPELLRRGHLFILQTPLFRVRNKKQTIYCYSEEEKLQAIHTLKGNPEITRFKGLGEISPDEFKNFISENIRLEPVQMKKHESMTQMLEFYMGKNTPERQDFIIENLYIEKDEVA
jgi:topoisomerase-4 subunit B